MHLVETDHGDHRISALKAIVEATKSLHPGFWLGARSWELEAGYNHPFRNEKALRMPRRNDFPFNFQ